MAVAIKVSTKALAMAGTDVVSETMIFCREGTPGVHTKQKSELKQVFAYS
jgi:hypothetical protein